MKLLAFSDLHRDLDQVTSRGQRRHRTYVELVGDVCLQLLAQLSPSPRGHHGPGQRLPGLDPGLGPCRPPELDDPADRRHLLAERG